MSYFNQPVDLLRRCERVTHDLFGVLSLLEFINLTNELYKSRNNTKYRINTRKPTAVFMLGSQKRPEGEGCDENSR